MDDQTEFGGYFIEDGKILMVSKPKLDKMPKLNMDGIKV